MALLALLDAMQPGADQGQPILDIHLDSIGLVPTIGAMAALDPDAAVTIFDRDLRGNTPLATCVTLVGEGRPGEIALELELSVVGGKTERHTVRHGELLRLPLTQGRYAQLTLRPAAGVRIGRAAPGEEVASDPAAIAGSALGVVIDARGRPLALPDDDRQRCLKIWEWLVALGVERGPSPYVESRQVVSMPIPVPVAIPTPAPAVAPALEVRPPDASKGGLGKRISLSELAAKEGLTPVEAPPPAAAPGSLDGDLDSLRQTVEPPKRRGLFGRKK
jgi:hypothetical protein